MEPLTREHESLGCPSCHAVAATWITDCDNPIHAEQANAYIHKLENENAALREQLFLKEQESIQITAALHDDVIPTSTPLSVDVEDVRKLRDQLAQAVSDMSGWMDKGETLSEAICNMRTNASALKEQLAQVTRERDTHYETVLACSQAMDAQKQRLATAQATVGRLLPLATGSDKQGGWTIAPSFLKQIEQRISSDDERPSWEQIEAVLLAQQALAQEQP